MVNRRPDILDRLEDILDRERALVLAGALTGLERIVEEKQAILNALPKDCAPDELVAIRAKAHRNAALLAAAAAGVRSVAGRLAEMKSGPPPLSTYGPDGRRAQISKARGKVERRA